MNIFKVSILIFTLFLVGCVHVNEKKINTEPSSEKKETLFSAKGILLHKEKNVGLLLINNKTPKKNDYLLESATLVDKYSSDLIVIDLSKVNKRKLKPGQKIEIWFEELKESNPPKTTVKKYKTIS
ncbi:DUF3221 domain-containing protein [Bacillus altitudinis]|uniref:DUF3221 domain-containing protein n=1 Tax=Bacillus altitudinis TaxID=293387 RepID=UPI001FB7E213|nr:DUF3221 domain-containing protein [Bacillus altitudinis]UOG09449.1 YobA family protein [Bacillus altitudinis]